MLNELMCRVKFIQVTTSLFKGQNVSMTPQILSCPVEFRSPLDCIQMMIWQLSLQILCAYIQLLSHVQLFAAPWTVAHLTALSMEFSIQEYQNGVPCLTPGDLPDPKIEPSSLASPELAGIFFLTRATWEAQLLSFLENISKIYSHFLQYFFTQPNVLRFFVYEQFMFIDALCSIYMNAILWTFIFLDRE